MPSWISNKVGKLQEWVEAKRAGREAGKFGEVANPKWASTTWGNIPIADSPQMRKSTLLFLPSASQGPLRFVLHRNILSGVAGPSHRIVALNRNGRMRGELIFSCGKDTVSIDALNAAKKDAGIGRSLVLLFAQHIPPEKKKITVHAAVTAIPFYSGLGFRQLGKKPVDELQKTAGGSGSLSKTMPELKRVGARGVSPGGQIMVCNPEELFKNKDELSKTGARKGRVFVR